MKTTLLTTVLIALLVTACKKDNGGQEGYNFTTAYKNTLNIQVTIQEGRQFKTTSGKDTTAFIEPGITIKAGETYGTSYFVCTKNCPVVYYDASPLIPTDFTKVTIGDKVKIDTNCYYFQQQNFNRQIDCYINPVNLYNDARWKKFKDGKGNIIRKEYVIDQSDLTQAK